MHRSGSVGASVKMCIHERLWPCNWSWVSLLCNIYFVSSNQQSAGVWTSWASRSCRVGASTHHALFISKLFSAGIPANSQLFDLEWVFTSHKCSCIRVVGFGWFCPHPPIHFVLLTVFTVLALMPLHIWNALKTRRINCVHFLSIELMLLVLCLALTSPALPLH